MKNWQVWFLVGSQDLYGEETLRQVESHAREMADFINSRPNNPITFLFKGVLKNPNEIVSAVREANNDVACCAVCTWMHTFSPAKMWINGLTQLKKPMLHLHTQYNEMLPYGDIDMDFMNLNQAAHGDREFGHICARLKLPRKVVAGYYKHEDVLSEIFKFCRVAAAVSFSRSLSVARFGDNMREVAVTCGDKVDAQRVFGWSVNGYGIGTLVEYVNAVSDSDVSALFSEYQSRYKIVSKDVDAIKVQARYEIALRRFLLDNNCGAFTTNFQELHGMEQLPGLACQRLMGDGIGFGAEGDWKTSALNAVMSYMAKGKKGGTSFMEDYTYHLEKGKELVLGSHMLEVSPDIASGDILIDVLPLAIGGKSAPARMIFDSIIGDGIVASLIDLGEKFRLIINKVEVVRQPKAMPKLPVARCMWKPLPDFKTATAGWIYAGGAHHTVLSTALTTENLLDFAKMHGIETVVIDEGTSIRSLSEL